MNYVDGVKRLAPASLKVVLRDGTERAVAVPKAGNRWSRLQQVVDSLSWERIECLDKDGRLLGVVESEEEDGDMEDATGGELLGLARVMEQVMRSTFREARQMVDVQLRGTAEMMSAMSDAMRAASATYRDALQVQRSYLMTAPAASDEGEPAEAAIMRMLQMAMMLKAPPQAPVPHVQPPRKDEP